MLLSMLEENQRESFLVMAKKCIDSDEIVDMNEAQLFGAMREEMGLEAGVFNFEETVEIQEIVSAFHTRRSKVVVMLELLKICLSDGDYSFDERDFVRRVSDAMELSTNDLFVMRSWVEKKIKLDSKLNKFLEE